MKTQKRNSKHRPGLSRMLKEAGAIRQSKVMYVIKGLLKTSLFIGAILCDSFFESHNHPRRRYYFLPPFPIFLKQMRKLKLGQSK